MSLFRGAVVMVCLAACDGAGEAALQRADEAPASRETALVVLIADDGTLLVDGAPTDMAALRETVEDAERGPTRPRVRVRVSPAVSLRRLGEVVETLRAAGVEVGIELSLRPPAAH